MKAIRVHELGGPEMLRLEDIPEPPMEPRKVLIRVAFVGLNYADTNIRRGRYIMQPSLPHVPGLEVSGTVEAVGEEVDAQRFPIGSRVAALTSGGGGYAELATASATNAIPLPENVSLETGAAFPLQALTAYHILTTMGRLTPGESVLIQAAAGGVGTMAIQLARLLGAGQVIANAGGPDKLKLARSLGADETIDYLRENFPARVNEITQGRGVDLILESVGGQTLERSFECLAVLGRVVTFGSASGSQADLNNLWSSLRGKSQALIGFHLSAALGRAELREQSIRVLLDHLLHDRIKVVIGHCFDLADASSAHAALESRRTTGKILLRVAA